MALQLAQKKGKRVQSWPIPASVTELRSFLGLCLYYRRFIRNFATVAKPLHDLTSPGVKFHWTDTCQQSFEILKTMLCQSPVLAYPSREGKFVLELAVCSVKYRTAVSMSLPMPVAAFPDLNANIVQLERKFLLSNFVLNIFTIICMVDISISVLIMQLLGGCLRNPLCKDNMPTG